ncbi:hypothetical protein [Mesorhizobium sp. ESP6-5]|uniref:hypothetical protein n=1 Tax=Mesorhizobium sp. ESP6-5 TaxID=2876623 RepID=UPI001CCBACA5|nr:hypothetical protein [Mesorhizobium sp. ESP6-5]
MRGADFLYRWDEGKYTRTYLRQSGPDPDLADPIADSVFAVMRMLVGSQEGGAIE